MEKCNRCRLGQISLQGSHTRLTPSPANSLPIFRYDALSLMTCIACIFFHNQFVQQIGQISGSPLEKLGESTYEELFVTALKNHGMLSIGLYRLEYQQQMIIDTTTSMVRYQGISRNIKNNWSSIPPPLWPGTSTSQTTSTPQSLATWSPTHPTTSKCTQPIRQTQ